MMKPQNQPERGFPHLIACHGNNMCANELRVLIMPGGKQGEAMTGCAGMAAVGLGVGDVAWLGLEALEAKTTPDVSGSGGLGSAAVSPRPDIRKSPGAAVASPGISTQVWWWPLLDKTLEAPGQAG